MNLRRRSLLKFFSAIGVGLLSPLRLFAAERNKPAFESKTLQDIIKNIGTTKLLESKEISIKASDIAENGTQVVIEVTSEIPATQTIYIILDRNPFPLAASFNFFEGAEPYFRAPFKIQETSQIHAIIRSGDQFYRAQKKIEVTIGGCGV